MFSFAPLLNGLGLKCQFVEDQDATARLKNRLPPRNQSFVRAAAWQVTLTRRFMQKIGRLGGVARITRLTPKQRSELARKAANARRQKGMSAGVSCYPQSGYWNSQPGNVRFAKRRHVCSCALATPCRTLRQRIALRRERRVYH